jgi:hypothetical protein
MPVDANAQHVQHAILVFNNCEAINVCIETKLNVDDADSTYLFPPFKKLKHFSKIYYDDDMISFINEHTSSTAACTSLRMSYPLGTLLLLNFSQQILMRSS